MEKKIFIEKGDTIVFNDKDIVICGDCLEQMKRMPSKFVDVFFTSPPYNDSGTENEDVANLKSNNTHKKYETVERHDDWFEWQCEVIDEALRVTKKYVLYNIQGISNNRTNVYKLIGKYADRIHDILIWNKINGAPTSTPHKISNTYEYVLIIKPDGVDGVDVKDNFFRNVINLNINPNKDYGKIHRALMSQEFCDTIIYQFTQEGDTVLDCFNGLGTTMLSCQKYNCSYIGIELSEKYCQTTIERFLEYDMGERNVRVVKEDETVLKFEDFKDNVTSPQLSIFDF